MAETFVGRELELKRIADATSCGGVAGVLVSGDAGSGKSSLLARAVEEAGEAARLPVTGYETEQAVPLAAASPLLRRLVAAERHGDTLDRLAFRSDSPVEPVRIFEAARRACAEVMPAWLVIDDLQWADALSVALATYLIRAAADAGEPLALIAAARPSPETTRFRNALTRIVGDQLVELELGALPREAGVALAQALRPGLEEETAAEYWARAEGSPFWLKAIVAGEGDEAAINHLVSSRLRGASADAAEALAVFSLSGRPLPLGEAGHVLEWSNDRLHYAVRELVARGVLVERIDGIAVAHDLIRTAAANETPRFIRQRLHRRIAGWLEDFAGDDVQVLQAALAHRRTAGLDAVALALRLARSPQRRLLDAQGIADLGTIADSADPTEVGTLELHEALGSLAAEVGQSPLALHHWNVVADSDRDPARRGAAHVECARAARKLARADEVKLHLRQARALQIEDPLLEAEIDAEEAAHFLWLEGDTTHGRALIRGVVRRARDLAVTPTETRLSRARHLYFESLRLAYEAALQDWDRTEMLMFAQERTEASRGVDEQVHLSGLIQLGAATASSACHEDSTDAAMLAEAEALTRRAWEESRQRIYPVRTIGAGSQLAELLARRGALTEAEAVVSEAVDLGRRVVADISIGPNLTLLTLSRIAFERGRWREAIEHLKRDGVAEASDHLRISFHDTRARMMARVGGVGLDREIRVALADARSCADAVGCPRCTAGMLLTTAEAFARTGRIDEAAAALERWAAAGARRFIGNHPQTALHHVTALMRSSRGDSRAAGLELERLAQEAVELCWPVEALWMRLDAGSALVSVDAERAVTLLAATAERAREIGAGTVQQLAEQRLRALGVRTWTRGRAGDELTERERQVMRLVAEGASNPEIAQTLFLSRKTVERHVSNLLRKVGARNRAELAARTADLEREGAPR